MDRLLHSYLGQINISEEQTPKNLTAYPVLSTKLSALDYITLDEALKQGLIEISEIDKDGSVPDLKLTNKSERMILTVSRLLDQFGFDTVDAGPLKEGWRIQRDTPGYGPRRTAAELRRDLAAPKRYAEQ